MTNCEYLDLGWEDDNLIFEYARGELATLAVMPSAKNAIEVPTAYIYHDIICLQKSAAHHPHARLIWHID